MIFQFAISLILIVGTLIMAQQLAFVRNTKLGFEKEQVVVLPMQDSSLRQRYESFKNELLRHEKIETVAAGYDMPGGTLGTNTFRPEGVPSDELPSLRTLFADYDYIQTLGLELVAGRGFDRDFATDATEAFVLNEAAVRVLGWQDPIGKRFGWGDRHGRVIGVVRDFHFASLHEQIAPLVIFIYPNMFRHIAVRVAPQDLAATIQFIEETWKQFAPSRPFAYSFLDDRFNKLYQADERFQQVWTVFASLAILVACLGLFGLSALTTQKRMKEIGIRKVLGASATGIVLQLSREFTRLVAIAFVVAAPIAFLAMQRWLAGFAYRVDVSTPPFLLSGFIMLAIAMLTISYQSIRAALSNPVDSLRAE